MIAADETDKTLHFNFSVLTMMAMRRKEAASQRSMRFEPSHDALLSAAKWRTAWTLSTMQKLTTWVSFTFIWSWSLFFMIECGSRWYNLSNRHELFQWNLQLDVYNMMFPGDRCLISCPLSVYKCTSTLYSPVQLRIRTTIRREWNVGNTL